MISFISFIPVVSHVQSPSEMNSKVYSHKRQATEWLERKFGITEYVIEKVIR